MGKYLYPVCMSMAALVEWNHKNNVQNAPFHIVYGERSLFIEHNRSWQHHS